MPRSSPTRTRIGEQRDTPPRSYWGYRTRHPATAQDVNLSEHRAQQFSGRIPEMCPSMGVSPQFAALPPKSKHDCCVEFRCFSGLTAPETLEKQTAACSHSLELVQCLVVPLVPLFHLYRGIESRKTVLHTNGYISLVGIKYSYWTQLERHILSYVAKNYITNPSSA